MNKLQVSISHTPMAKFTGEPEVVTGIEIGHLVPMLRHLSEIAGYVLENDNVPVNSAAYIMAQTIRQIERVIRNDYQN